MKKSIPPELKNQLNAEVLTKLQGKNCHSDMVEPIQSYLSKLKEVKSYCSDEKSFGYIIWYINNVIFAYAAGMQKVGLRLSQSGELNLKEAKYPRNYKAQNSWYEIPYNSEKLEVLVNSAYESARNS